MKTIRLLAAAILCSCAPGEIVPADEPAIGNRDLLVILWNPHDPAYPAPDKQAVEDVIFGSDPSVAGYYSANSRGKAGLKKAAVLGWYDALKPADHYWSPPDPEDSDGDGWIDGDVEKWAEAIRFAAAEFDFSAYDRNGDGVLQPEELGILIVIPKKDPFGTNRYALGRQYPTAEPLVVDGVAIGMIAEAYIGDPPSAPLVAHELGHLFFGAPDMYFWFFNPYAAGSYSIFDQCWTLTNVDPYNKMRWGWLDPFKPETSGWYSLRSMDQTGDLIMLSDPRSHSGEFFLIENRHRGRYYDHDLASEGLAIWNIIDDPAVYSTMPAPPGVSETDWAQVAPTDWGRRVIRMIRPEITVFDDGQALWGPADEIRLFWHDGTPSRFTLRSVSSPGAEMDFYLEVAE